MKDLALIAGDFVAKAKSARADIADLDSLRKLQVPGADSSFVVSGSLFVWAKTDTTPDDGVTSIRPGQLPPAAAGRYRRATIAIHKSQVA